MHHFKAEILEIMNMYVLVINARAQLFVNPLNHTTQIFKISIKRQYIKISNLIHHCSNYMSIFHIYDIPTHRSSIFILINALLFDPWGHNYKQGNIVLSIYQQIF